MYARTMFNRNQESQEIKRVDPGTNEEKHFK
jgi:hypothetical protein